MSIADGCVCDGTNFVGASGRAGGSIAFFHEFVEYIYGRTGRCHESSRDRGRCGCGGLDGEVMGVGVDGDNERNRRLVRFVFQALCGGHNVGCASVTAGGEYDSFSCSNSVRHLQEAGYGADGNDRGRQKACGSAEARAQDEQTAELRVFRSVDVESRVGRVSAGTASEERAEGATTSGVRSGVPFSISKFGVESRSVASRLCGSLDHELCESNSCAGVRESRSSLAENSKRALEQTASAVDESRSMDGDMIRGKNYGKNKAKREKIKALRAARRADEVSSGELELKRSLSARRLVENKLAIVRGEMQLKSYADVDKTRALEILSAARMEQRINEAKAKSQASFKKCDESAKSLGSTGSAGEFALKQEIKKGRDNAIILEYVKAQADVYAKYATPEVNAIVASMKPPVLENEFDVFGDCPEHYTEDQRESYFLGLALRQEENDMRTGIAC